MTKEKIFTNAHYAKGRRMLKSDSRVHCACTVKDQDWDPDLNETGANLILELAGPDFILDTRY